MLSVNNDFRYTGITTVNDFFNWLRDGGYDYFICEQAHASHPVSFLLTKHENSFKLEDLKANHSFFFNKENKFIKEFTNFVNKSIHYRFISTVNFEGLNNPLLVVSDVKTTKDFKILIFGDSPQSLNDCIQQVFDEDDLSQHFDTYYESISENSLSSYLEQLTKDLSKHFTPLATIKLEVFDGWAYDPTTNQIYMETKNNFLIKSEDYAFVESKKENNTMSNDILNFSFGPVSNNSARLSAFGLALKNGDGKWVSYNKETDEIIDCSILNFAGADKMFYKVPCAIADIATGDVIVHNHKAMFVVNTIGGIEVVDVSVGERKTILPTKSPFGFDFVTKIVSLIDFGKSSGATSDNPFGSFLPFLLLGDNAGDIDPLMFMAMSGSTGLDISNPMMMYALLSKDGNSNSMLPFLLMNNPNIFGAKS